MSSRPHLAVLEGGEHAGETRPNPDTIISERSGRPVKLTQSAVTWPLLADCAACGKRVRLDRPYGDWQHSIPALLGWPPTCPPCPWRGPVPRSQGAATRGGHATRTGLPPALEAH